MKKDMTEMVFVLDRSGSMHHLEADTIGGFNSVIEKQKKEKGEAVVTTILFDSGYSILHDRFPLKDVKPMTEEEYCTMGSTALLDALGSSIQKQINVQKNLPEESRAEKVVFVVITDGRENSSCEYSYDMVRKLVESQEEAGWEFLFLGANMDAVKEGSRFGIRESRAASYKCDSEGLNVLYESLSSALNNVRSRKCIDPDWKYDIEEDLKKRGRRKV